MLHAPCPMLLLLPVCPPESPQMGGLQLSTIPCSMPHAPCFFSSRFGEAGRGKNIIVDSIFFVFIIIWILAVYILRLMCTFMPQGFEHAGMIFVSF